MFQVIITSTVIFLLVTSSYIDVLDEDETLYVGSDDELNKEFTKVEIIEHGRYAEVFSDELVVHTRKQVEAHMSSSTEDLIDIFVKEQTLIQRLLDFLDKIEQANIATINLSKIRKSITSLLEHYISNPGTTEDSQRSISFRLCISLSH